MGQSPMPLEEVAVMVSRLWGKIMMEQTFNKSEDEKNI